MIKPSIIEQHGYCWLQLPRESVLPLTLLERDNSGILNRLKRKIMPIRESAIEVSGATLFTIFPITGSGKVPEMAGAKAASVIKGYDLISLEGNVSVKGNFPLIDDADATLSVKKARNLLYSFDTVQHIQVDNIILLEEHLNLNPYITNAPGYIQKLKNNQIYIVTEVLQTNNFNIQDAADFVFGANLNIDAIENYVALKANLNVTSDYESIMKYTGTKPITFAIKAAQIIYNEGKNNFSISQTSLKQIRNDSQLDIRRLSYKDV